MARRDRVDRAAPAGAPAGWLAALVVIVMPVLAATSAAAAPAPAAPTASAGPDLAALDRLEEASEQLANRLLEMSLATRRGRAAELAPYFGDSVGQRLPGFAPAAAPELRWVESVATDVSAPEATLSRNAFLASLQSLLDRWSSIEDARFKLAASTVRDRGKGTLAGRFSCYVVGRSRDGHREWLKGEGEIEAARDAAGAWRVGRFVFDKARLLLARKDAFVEVSGPAGVARRDPSLLERGGRGLVSHGAAAGDVDGDGLLDVLATGLRRNALFRNRGDGTFEDVAEKAGIAFQATAGVAPLLLDVDGDGDLDAFITSVGRQSLFENRLVPDGVLKFRDISSKAGVDVEASAFSAAAADVDGDGRPDIFVACYGRYGEVVPDSWDHATNGERDLLFMNRADGTFHEEAAARGVADGRWGYAAELADIDDDGDADLYVANDFGGPDGLYLNEGGRFRDVAAERGLGQPGYSMGVSFGDVDLDGDLDLHVTRMSSTAGRRILGRLDSRELPARATLQALASGDALMENTGGGHFRDVSAHAGPFGAGWAWGGGLFDADSDGRPDLYVPNGFLSGSSMADT